MQIGSSLTTQSLLVDHRRGGAVAQPRPAAAEGELPERPREVFRLRAAEPLSAQPAEQWQSLSPQNRNAMQSYLSNGPTLAERFGVELAGVDLYV